MGLGVGLEPGLGLGDRVGELVSVGVGLEVLVASAVIEGVETAGDWAGEQALTISNNVSEQSTDQYRFKVSPMAQFVGFKGTNSA